MNKSIKDPQQKQESEKAMPLEEVSKVKKQKAEVGEVVSKPKEDTPKGHKRTP